LEDLTLFGFEVISGRRALAGAHCVDEFLLETDRIGPLPGGQDLLGVLRYVHRIKSP
jgi:hypothetical protein